MKNKKTSNNLFKKFVAYFTIFITMAVVVLVSNLKIGCAANVVSKTTPILLKQGVVNKVTVGDEFSVTLSSNPSTGYKWTSSFSKSGILQLVSDDYVAGGNVPGSPGNQVFKLKAIKEGKCNVTFRYYRPFEGIKSNTRTIVYNIEVSSKKSTITLQEGKINRIKLSDIAIVKLSSNPTTGYSWYYTSSRTNALKLVSDEYIASSNMPGASGTQVFNFEATARGRVRLTFRYYRSFEGIKSDTKMVVYDIIVN